jgi:hypothetical protein
MAASLSGIFLVHRIVTQGETVRIEADEKAVYIFPLNKNNTVVIKGPLGNTYVEIRDHRVRITESPCKNKLCVRQGWMQKGAIICLPNRVIVTIEGSPEQNGTVDAITG